MTFLWENKYCQKVVPLN